MNPEDLIAALREKVTDSEILGSYFKHQVLQLCSFYEQQQNVILQLQKEKLEAFEP